MPLVQASSVGGLVLQRLQGVEHLLGRDVLGEFRELRIVAGIKPQMRGDGHGQSEQSCDLVLGEQADL